MSVAVLFAGPSTPPHHREIRNALEAVPCRNLESWEVVVTVDGPNSPWTIAVTGPDFHRHVFRIDGRDSVRCQPDYLSWLLRAEIEAFPSCPPNEFVYAVAELSLEKIPVDLSDAFSGHVSVDGVRTDIRTLTDLHRQGRLDKQSLQTHIRGALPTD